MPGAGHSGVHLRKYPRLAATFPLAITIRGDFAAKHGHARDIGGGGIYFETDEPAIASASDIHRSFISSASGTDVAHPEIVHTVTSLARSLALKTTADGIDTSRRVGSSAAAWRC